MYRKRILASILALSLVVNISPIFQIKAKAEDNEGSSPRTTFTDWPSNPEEWDGVTYDDSWRVNEEGNPTHTGTAADPYVISSNEQFADFTENVENIDINMDLSGIENDVKVEDFYSGVSYKSYINMRTLTFCDKNYCLGAAKNTWFVELPETWNTYTVDIEPGSYENNSYSEVKVFINMNGKRIRVKNIEPQVIDIYNSSPNISLNSDLQAYFFDDKATFRLYQDNIFAVASISISELNIKKPDSVVVENFFGDTKTIYEEEWDNYDIYTNLSQPSIEYGRGMLIERTDITYKGPSDLTLNIDNANIRTPRSDYIGRYGSEQRFGSATLFNLTYSTLEEGKGLFFCRKGADYQTDKDSVYYTLTNNSIICTGTIEKDEGAKTRHLDIKIVNSINGEVLASTRINNVPKIADWRSWGNSYVNGVYDEVTNTIQFTVYLGYLRYIKSYRGSVYSFNIGKTLSFSVNDAKLLEDNLVLHSATDFDDTVIYNSTDFDFVGNKPLVKSLYYSDPRVFNVEQAIEDTLTIKRTTAVIKKRNENQDSILYIKLESDICGEFKEITNFNNIDFDLNNHLIKNTGENIKYNFVKNTNEYTSIHNGKLFDVVISMNKGKIFDITYYDINGTQMVMSNEIMGEIYNIKVYGALNIVFCQGNYGIIHDIDITLCHEYGSGIETPIVSCIFESGLVYNIHLMFDFDKLDYNKYCRALILGSCYGTARDIVVDKINIPNCMGFLVTSYLAGTIENVSIDLTCGMTQEEINTYYQGEYFFYNKLCIVQSCPNISNSGVLKNSSIKINTNLNCAPSVSDTWNHTIFDNVDVDITIRNDYFNQVEGSVYNSYPLIGCIFRNSKLIFKNEAEQQIKYNSINGYGGNIFHSDINIDNIEVVVFNEGLRINSSNILVDKLSTNYISDGYFSYSVSNPVYDMNLVVNELSLNKSTTYSSIFGGWQLVNSNIILNKVTNIISPLCPFYAKNTKLYAKISDNVTIGEPRYTSYSSGVKNCLFVIDADEEAQGYISPQLVCDKIEDTILILNTKNLKITDKTNEQKGMLISHPSNYGKGYTNVTVFAPNISVAPIGTSMQLIGGSWNGWCSVQQNVNVYANIKVVEASNLEVIRATISPSLLRDSAFYLSFRDSNDDILSDVGFIGISSNNDSEFNAVYNTAINLSMKPNKYLFYSAGQKTAITKNCYLNISDLPEYPALAERENYDGFIGGWLSGFSYDSSYGNTIDWKNHGVTGSISMCEGTKGISNCYVKVGTNVVPGWFSTTDEYNSWNASAIKLNTPNNSIYPSIWEAKEAGAYVKDSIAGIKSIDTSMELTGELAYLLDNGSNRLHRTYSWTVVDAFDVKNPYTNEIIMHIPTHLGHTELYLDNFILSNVERDDLNLAPIFKYTISDTPRGSVEITGINGSTTDGDIFAKKNSNIVTDIITDDEETILVYATQKFKDSVPVRIPSQILGNETVMRARTAALDYNYNIKGYKGQGIDTIITPVFKTARYITVNVTGEENGTIVPDTYVSAEGELVKIVLQVDEGYTVTNIKINGVPLTKSSFIMPDDNVEITGDVIPFEGGITKFRLFGTNGVIDQIEHTITLNVPKVGNINNGLPIIEYVGNYITPNVGVRLDFSNPVEYTVNYGDNQEVTYTVTVNQSEYTMRIYDFIVNGVQGNINQALKTIEVYLPAGTDLSNIIPDDIVYSAENITPERSEAKDFRVSIPYTLSTLGMESVTYIVNIYAVDTSAARIEEFKVSGYNGVIDEENGTITLTVPQGIDFSNIMPDNIRYVGKAITPLKSAKVNLEDNASYTVINQLNEATVYDIRLNYLSDDEAHIDKFTLAGIDGIIDQVNHTITVHVPSDADIVDVAPEELLYTGKSIYPRVTEIFDFSSDAVTYTVIAQDNTEVTYTVILQNTEALLTEFELCGQEGIINQNTKTVTVEIPYGIDISNAIPNLITISEGATITPEKLTVRDFTEVQEYEVTSEDGLTTNVYQVICNQADDYDNKILKYTVDGVNGVITNIADDRGTIEITIKDRVNHPDYSNIVPDEIIISNGASISPSKNIAVNLSSNTLQYIVEGRGSGQRIYDVKLNIIPMDTTAIITKYTVDGVDGNIDQESGKITVTMPEGYDGNLTSVIPQIVWQGEKISPNENENVDLTREVKYTITAEDPRVKKEYTVDVIIAEIPSYKVIVEASIGGTVSYSPTTTYHFEGDEIVLTASANVGYKFKSFVVDGVKIIETSFLMPNHDVRVSAIFEETDTPPISDKCIITKYKYQGYYASINQNTGDIVLEIPKENEKYIKGKHIPEIIEWEGKTLTPDVTDMVDVVTNPKYIVTAENGSIKVYTVKVKWIDNSRPIPIPIPDDCIITRYEYCGYVADIDQVNDVITLRIPKSKEVDISGLHIPDRIDWKGKTITPNTLDKVNILDSPKYKVISEKGNSRVYVVKIEWIDDVVIPPSDDCIITKYKYCDYIGEIDQINNDIVVKIPKSQKENVVGLHIPDVIEWVGATLTPSEQESVDLTKIPKYKVIAESGNSRIYTVRIEWVDDKEENLPEKSDVCIITKYEYQGYVGEVNQDKNEIVIRVPKSEEEFVVGYHIPDKIEWEGESLFPSEWEYVDLTENPEYIVTAENGNSRTYTVRIEWIEDKPTEKEESKSSDCSINIFNIDEYVGKINQEELKIVIEMPKTEKDNMKFKVPYIEWVGIKLNPEETEAQDFTKVNYYTVTAEDEITEKTYRVQVKFTDEPVDDKEENPYTGDNRRFDILYLLLCASVITLAFNVYKRKDK